MAGRAAWVSVLHQDSVAQQPESRPDLPAPLGSAPLSHLGFGTLGSVGRKAVPATGTCHPQRRAPGPDVGGGAAGKPRGPELTSLPLQPCSWVLCYLDSIGSSPVINHRANPPATALPLLVSAGCHVHTSQSGVYTSDHLLTQPLTAAAIAPAHSCPRARDRTPGKPHSPEPLGSRPQAACQPARSPSESLSRVPASALLLLLQPPDPLMPVWSPCAGLSLQAGHEE